MRLLSATFAAALLLSAPASATLYTDSGIPANRVNVMDAGGLASALALPDPLWVPAGNHTLPNGYDLTGSEDIACEAGAIIAITGGEFITNGGGSFSATGCTFTGDGNDWLFSLNSATAWPALIRLEHVTFTGASEVAYSEWECGTNGRIGEIDWRHVTGDSLGIGSGTHIANGVKRVYIEDYERRNFKRMGLAIYVHCDYPTQQAEVEWATYRDIRLLNGKGGGSSATNSNGMYVGGQNVDIDGLLIRDWSPPQNSDGTYSWSQDGDDTFYSKSIHLSLRNARLWNGTTGPTFKGQQWGNTTGPGPVGGGNLIENLVIGHDEGWPFGMSGVLDQSRGSYFRNIETSRLGNFAYLNHDTTGATIIDGWNDHSRPEGSIPDNGKGVFNNRSDEGALGVLTILNSSVQPEYMARAAKQIGPDPKPIIDDAFNNNWN